MARFRHLVVATALAAPILVVAAEQPAVADPEQVVREAIAHILEIPEQARALARLAWPAAAAADPAVAEHARRRLVDYGENALPVLAEAVTKVKPAQQADVVSALLEAHRSVRSGIPPSYLPALEAAAWYGTEDARHIAIPELGRHRYSRALLTIVDSAHEFPALTPVCVRALGQMGDERARFFLERVLNEGSGENAALAAMALAQIGGRGVLPLKAALRSPDRERRVAAARALLPVAGVDDLSSIYEYVARHPEDDPPTIEALREATLMLEKLLQAREAGDAASPGP